MMIDLKTRLDHMDHEEMTLKIVMMTVLDSRLKGKTSCFVPIWTAWPDTPENPEELPSRRKVVLNHALEGKRLHLILEVIGCHVTEIHVPVGTIAVEDETLRFFRMSSRRDSDYNPAGYIIEWDAEENSKTGDIRAIWESILRPGLGEKGHM